MAPQRIKELKEIFKVPEIRRKLATTSAMLSIVPGFLTFCIAAGAGLPLAYAIGLGAGIGAIFGVAVYSLLKRIVAEAARLFEALALRRRAVLNRQNF